MLTISSGLPALDALLDGGFPTSRLTELSGPPACTTRVVAACLAAYQQRVPDRHVVYTALSDQVDLAPLTAEGVDLDRLVVVTPATRSTAVSPSPRVGGFIISGLPAWVAQQPQIYAYVRYLARLIQETPLFLLHLVTPEAVVPSAARAASVRLRLTPRPAAQVHAVLLKHPHLPAFRAARLAWPQ